MDNFKNIFRRVLTEADRKGRRGPNIKVDVPDISNDRGAFEAALEKDTPPDTFDTQGISDESQVSSIETAKHWINELDSFADKLNDPSPDSLNTFLNSIDREDSLFRGISKSQSDTIIGIAGSLRDLAEALKGHIIQAPKKQADNQIQQSIGPTNRN